MTTLQEEEELFGASLSKDFYQSPRSPPKNHPWLSSSTQRSSNAFARRGDAPSDNERSVGRRVEDNRRREPYELLDDVPPMSFETARYPVEEQYPAVDDGGDGKGETGRRDDCLDRSRKSCPIPPSPSTSLNNRYPIDDVASEYSQEEVDSYNQTDSYYFSSPRRHQHVANDVDVAITESKSDSDISEYHPMSDERLLVAEYRIVKEKAEAVIAGDDLQFRRTNDNIRADCDMIDMTDERARMTNKTKMPRSKVSVSSFDRLYDDEIVTMEVDSSDGYVSPREDYKWTPMSEGTDDYVSPRENPIWANVKVDIKAPTPIRSNRLNRHPASPYVTAASPMSETSSPPFNSSSSPSSHSAHPPTPPVKNRKMSQTTSTLVATSSSPSSPMILSPTPPPINRRSTTASEIFRINGTDSCISSKSGVYLSEEKSESSAPLSDAPSSDCSAIQDLNSLQNRTSQGEIMEEYASKPLKWREDPPTHDFGYYPQNKGAKEPEGYIQHGMFPDIDLWGGKAGVMDKEKLLVAPPLPPAAATKRVTVNEQDNRQYEPPASPCYHSGYPENGNHQCEGGDLMNNNSMHGIDDSYDCYNESFCSMITYRGNSPSRKDNNKVSDNGKEAMGYKFRNGQIEQKYVRAVADLDDESNNDGVSIISEDTGIQILVKRQQKQKERKHMMQQRQDKLQQKSQRRKSESYYHVKQKDSMESDIKIDNDLTANDKKGPKYSRREKVQTYADIKQNDSMEKEMSVDFDEQINYTYDKKNIDEDGHEDKFPNNHGDVSSPPMIRRKPFSFENAHDGDYNRPDYDDNMGRFDNRGSRSVVFDSSYSSHDDDSESGASEASEASEASDDPAFFPFKAISQMNLGHHHKNDDANESDDLMEQAFSHLSRGRNNEALAALKEALKLAELNVNDAKKNLDNLYIQNKVRAKKQDNVLQLKSDLRDSGSEMADVLNNIGVVQEVMGDYQLAMNSFRDALDVYRNMCHRYENTGDGDVDRTVSNIMQMGIAQTHHDRRMELHREAEELAAQTAHWLNSDYQNLCTQLQIKRLNALMCVLDLETESLGRDHPAVGFTLLKKGKLHLEMKHIDMAIKDTRDAVSILKKALGSIHPEVGLALVKLGDIFNYNVGRYGGGCEDSTDNKYMALSLYQEALMPLRESFGEVNPHLGLAYNCLGILYSSRGELKKAMSSFYDALSSYGVRSRANNRVATDNGQQTSSRPEVFFVWINVGGLHMMKTEWHLALRSYLKAHSAFRCLNDEETRRLQMIAPTHLMRYGLTLSKGRSSFDDSDTLLAAVLHNIGKAQSMLHQYGKAIETFEEALRVHQVVAIRTDGNTNSSRDVARILENLGEIEMISGDLTSAFGRYVESLNVLRSSAHVDDSSIEVALVLGAIGQVHLKKGEYTEAKVVLKESMRMFEKLGVPPNNRRINEIRSCLVDSELALMQNATSTLAAQRREISIIPYVDKALAIDEIADAYRNKGDYAEAIWYYSEALATRRRRLDRKQSLGQRDSSEIVDVGRTISNIAQLRRQRREFGAAKILFDQVKELYRSVGLSTSHPFFMDLIQEIEVMQNM